MDRESQHSEYSWVHRHSGVHEEQSGDESTVSGDSEALLEWIDGPGEREEDSDDSAGGENVILPYQFKPELSPQASSSPANADETPNPNTRLSSLQW